MKPCLRVLTCILLFELIITACAPAQPGPTAVPRPTLASSATIPPSPVPIPDRGSLDTGTVVSKALEGNLYGDPTTRPFRVYLPPSYYVTARRYPVIFLLPQVNDPNHGDTIIMLQNAADELARGGQGHEAILVFPDCDTKFHGCQYLSSSTLGDYEGYITREVVSKIDSTYRTLASPDSRGVTGCGGDGGDGAVGLAFKYPRAFSVAVSVGGVYDWEHDPVWEKGLKEFTGDPQSWSDTEEHRDAAGNLVFPKIGFNTAFLMLAAAAASPNPDKPPFYLDMPFKIANGKAQIVQEVFEKIVALDPVHELERYLAQPVRLRGLMLYQGEKDPPEVLSLAQEFDKTLTSRGVEHTYIEAPGASSGYCRLEWKVVMQFMLDHLVH